MKWTLTLAAVLMLGAAADGATARIPAHAAAKADKQALPSVQAFAEALVRDGKVPGITIGIGTAGGPTRWVTAGKTAFGADGRPATPDTLWRIFSMTKPITGIAAMILVDEGKLRLGQPVSDFFPEFRNGRVLVDPEHGLATRPATREMTVRDLMTHVSGLGYAITSDTPARKELAAQGLVPIQVNRVVEARVRPLRPATLAAFAKRVGAMPLVADPASKWSYAMGLDVLAAVVERASGMPFETFVQRRLFTPLKMRSTAWQISARAAPNLVTLYAPTALFEKYWPGAGTPATPTLSLVETGANSVYLTAPSFPYGGAGLISTARDYDRFLQMLQNDGMLDGKRILGGATARLALSNLMPPGVFLTGSGPVAPGEPVGFGAGGFVTLRDVDGLGRGKGTYGWDGAAGTRAWVDPVRGVRATMMINLLGAGAIGQDFDRAIAADLKAAQ